MAEPLPDNEHIAGELDRVAELLDLHQEERYRARSYRRAARSIREADEPVAELVAERGEEWLRSLPGVGEKLARAILEIVETGGLALLDRLADDASRDAPFTRLPGLREDEAARIHAALGIETLEELEQAAHHGLLGQVEGLGGERVEAIRAALERLLGRAAACRRDRMGVPAAGSQFAGQTATPPSGRAEGTRPRRTPLKRIGPTPPGEEPPVALLLELDAEYRAKAEAGQLRRIAPRRLNPEGEKWLPIMKAQREGWRFTALFSNTERAHEMGKTHEWVVLYYRCGAGPEDQCTVITVSRGPLRGKRIVRGREEECRDHYGL